MLVFKLSTYKPKTVIKNLNDGHELKKNCVNTNLIFKKHILKVNFQKNSFPAVRKRKRRREEKKEEIDDRNSRDAVVADS